MTTYKSFAGIYIDDVQLANLKTIYEVGIILGANGKDIQTAFVTVMAEASGRVLPGGDKDSVGAYQQRTPWGSYAARFSLIRSTDAFFNGGGANGTDGLFSIVGRADDGVAVAAQKVERSGNPSAYVKWVSFAQAVYRYLVAQDAAAEPPAQ